MSFKRLMGAAEIILYLFIFNSVSKGILKAM